MVTLRPSAAAAAPGVATRGFLVAWDPIARTPRWRIDLAPAGGTLSTAGNLVFVGDAGGRLMALNAETGQVLWEQRMAPGVATPVTYELDGRQYVSVLAGTSRGRIFTFALDAATPTSGQPQ